jgi:hypothetical protein
MSQVLGASSQLISGLGGEVLPAIPQLGNYYQSVVSAIQNDSKKISVWQQAVLRCIARPVAPKPRKAA